MKKSLLIVALVCVMVFSFAATAMADHSPDYYFDFQAGNGVVTGVSFQTVFPAAWNASFAIDNGSWALGTATPHSGYSQSTAKCEVCHAVHRAPTLGTGIIGASDGGLTTGTSSSRYISGAWTSEASTQMLLRSTTARACIYCHVIEAPDHKMYGGDATLANVGDTDLGWGKFYAHTTGCTACHAVHGANTFQGAGVASKILKYQGVKNLGTIALKVQPEVYGTTYSAANVSQVETGSLYLNKTDMIAGTLSPTASGAGVAPLAAAITAQCTICHAQYATGEETINANYMNATLFQPTTWANANGSVAKIWVGNSTDPASTLPGIPGLTYTGGDHTSMTGAAGSLIMAYKNHPLKAGGQDFKGAGAGAFFTSGSVHVSDVGSSVCQSCHNAPVGGDNGVIGSAAAAQDGNYTIQSFPHYTPGYYKFMAARDQSLFSTPKTLAQFNGGYKAFYSNPLTNKPAVMNDGYCTKCHSQVGIDY